MTVYQLSATDYDDGDISKEMVTDNEIVSSLFPAEEEEDDDESSSKSLPTVFTKDAVVAFETVFNFLQQGDIEINYDEFKAFEEKGGIA